MFKDVFSSPFSPRFASPLTDPGDDTDTGGEYLFDGTEQLVDGTENLTDGDPE